MENITLWLADVAYSCYDPPYTLKKIIKVLQIYFESASLYFHSF